MYSIWINDLCDFELLMSICFTTYNMEKVTIYLSITKKSTMNTYLLPKRRRMHICLSKCPYAISTISCIYEAKKKVWENMSDVSYTRMAVCTAPLFSALAPFTRVWACSVFLYVRCRDVAGWKLHRRYGVGAYSYESDVGSLLCTNLHDYALNS